MFEQEGVSAARTVLPTSCASLVGVLIIAHQPVFCQGVRSLLTDAGDAVALVGEAADGADVESGLGMDRKG